MAWWTLFKRELSSYFHSGVAYLVLFGSALVQGWIFNVLVQALVYNHYTQASIMQVFFSTPFFWILLFVQVPLITMRSFSEELKMGTVEMLMTAPVRDWDVVVAKFLGALVFFCILWSPVALDLLATQLFSSPAPPVYWSEIGLTALTIVLVGSFFVSIGIFASSLTRNQIIAAVLCFAFLFVPFGISLLKLLQNISAQTQELITYGSILEHMNNAIRGIFDSRMLVFYLTTTLLMLYLAKTVVENRRIKG